jgi:hypothetical protein
MNKFKSYLLGAMIIAPLLAVMTLYMTSFRSAALSAAPARGNPTHGPSSNSVDTSPLVEEFAIRISDFKMAHHNGEANLIITIRYRFKAGITDASYPDYEPMVQNIKAYLTNYPNEVDYWEIINKKLSLIVFEKYPVMSNITSEIQVSSSRPGTYSRSSIVTRNR